MNLGSKLRSWEIKCPFFTHLVHIKLHYFFFFFNFKNMNTKINQIFILKRLNHLKYFTKLCLFVLDHFFLPFAKFKICTIKLARWDENWKKKNSFEKKKLFRLKNPTTPTVFVEHPSNFAQTWTTKLLSSSRSRILNWLPKIFLEQPKIEISSENRHFNFFEKFQIF